MYKCVFTLRKLLQFSRKFFKMKIENRNLCLLWVFSQKSHLKSVFTIFLILKEKWKTSFYCFLNFPY